MVLREGFRHGVVEAVDCSLASTWVDSACGKLPVRRCTISLQVSKASR